MCLNFVTCFSHLFAIMVGHYIDKHKFQAKGVFLIIFFDPKYIYKITLFIIDSRLRVSLEKTEVSKEFLLFVVIRKNCRYTLWI